MGQKSVAGKLKEYRRRCLLTQAELAVKLGVTEKTYRDWENGRKHPQIRHLRKISKLTERG